MTKLFEQYGDYLKSNIVKADVDDPLRGPRDENPDKKLSEVLDKAVAEMVVAAPSLHPLRARRWLLHTEQGQALLSTFKRKKEPQMDISKLLEFTEQALMAQAQLHKRADQSEAKAFETYYNNNVEYRKQWRDLTEAKHSVALAKGMATLTPTMVGGNDAFDLTVADSSAKAVKLLQEMAAKNGRSFESEFSDPANRKLANATYTSSHRSSISATPER
jgi:hypothetical protein